MNTEEIPAAPLQSSIYDWNVFRYLLVKHRKPKAVETYIGILRDLEWETFKNKDIMIPVVAGCLWFDERGEQDLTCLIGFLSPNGNTDFYNTVKEKYIEMKKLGDELDFANRKFKYDLYSNDRIALKLLNEIVPQ